MAAVGKRVGAAVAAAALAVGVPVTGAQADHGPSSGHGDDSGQAAVLRLRRDAPGRIEQYADEGAVPGFQDLLTHGAYASDHGLLTQAPPNTGAGWFTLAPARGRACTARPTTRSTSTAQPFTNRTSFSGAERAAGRDARPVGRARRQEGRPDRVGGRAQRRDQRPDARLPQLLLRPRRRDELLGRVGHHCERHELRAPVRQGRPGRARPAGPTCRRRTRRPRRCACACSTPAPTSTA